MALPNRAWTGHVVRSLAESIDTTSPARVKELVALLVQAAPIYAGTIDTDQIDWTPAARPFFVDAAGVVGLKRPRRDSGTQ